METPVEAYGTRLYWRGTQVECSTLSSDNKIVFRRMAERLCSYLVVYGLLRGTDTEIEENTDEYWAQRYDWEVTGETLGHAIALVKEGQECRAFELSKEDVGSFVYTVGQLVKQLRTDHQAKPKKPVREVQPGTYVLRMFYLTAPRGLPNLSLDDCEGFLVEAKQLVKDLQAEIRRHNGGK